MERTFIMVKPNGVARGLVGEVVARFERRGFVLRGMKALRIDRALAERHYAEHTGKPEPLYTVPEPQLVAELSKARGTPAGVALTRVYRRLRALPSRGQAAAPWSAGYLARREFDVLYEDVAELCRTLGSELPALEA